MDWVSRYNTYMEPLNFDAVLVDGQNVSRMEAMMLQQSTTRIPVRKFFASVEHRQWGWYAGMEFVDVPVQGKEDVDRAIAIESVRLHLMDGIQRLLLVSHDMDYGATAMYLRTMFPDMHIAIAASAKRMNTEYLAALKANGIPFMPLFDLQKPILAASLHAIWREQQNQHPDQPVRLQDMHAELARRQHTNPRLHAPHMASDLTEMGFACVHPGPIRRDTLGKVLPQKHVAYSHVVAPLENAPHV